MLCANPPGPLGLIHIADAENSRPEESNRSFVGKLATEMSRQQQQLEGGGGMSARANGDDGDCCVRGSGGRHGVAGSLGGVWPVYAANHKSDGRSDPSFYINHFVGESGRVYTKKCIGPPRRNTYSGQALKSYYDTILA